MAPFSVFIPAYDYEVYVALPQGKTGPSTFIPKELPPRMTLDEARADLDAPEVAAEDHRYVIEYQFEGDDKQFHDQKAASEMCARNRVPLILLGSIRDQAKHVKIRHRHPPTGKSDGDRA